MALAMRADWRRLVMALGRAALNGAFPGCAPPVPLGRARAMFMGTAADVPPTANGATSAPISRATPTPLLSGERAAGRTGTARVGAMAF